MYHRVLNLLGWEKKDNLDFALLTSFCASNTSGMNGNFIMYVTGQNKKRKNTSVQPIYREVSIPSFNYSSLAAYKTTEGSQGSHINTYIKSSMQPHFDPKGLKISSDKLKTILQQRKQKVNKLVQASCDDIPFTMNGFQSIGFVIIRYLVPNFQYFRCEPQTAKVNKKEGVKFLVRMIFETVLGENSLRDLVDKIPDIGLSNDELNRRLQQVANSGIIELISIGDMVCADAVYEDLKNLKKKMMKPDKKSKEALATLLQAGICFQSHQWYDEHENHHVYWNYHRCWNYWSYEKVASFCSLLKRKLELKESSKKSLQESISLMFEKKINALSFNKKKKVRNLSDTTQLNVVSVPKNNCNSNDNTSFPHGGTDKRDSRNISNHMQHIVVSVPHDGCGTNDNRSVSDHSSLTSSTGSSFHKFSGNHIADPSFSAKLSHHPISQHATNPCVGNKSAIVSLPDDTISEHTTHDDESLLFKFPWNSVTLWQLNEYACDLTISQYQICSEPTLPSTTASCCNYLPYTPIQKDDLHLLKTGGILSNRVITFFYNW